MQIRMSSCSCEEKTPYYILSVISTEGPGLLPIFMFLILYMHTHFTLQRQTRLLLMHFGHVGASDCTVELTNGLFEILNILSLYQDQNLEFFNTEM